MEKLMNGAVVAPTPDPSLNLFSASVYAQDPDLVNIVSADALALNSAGPSLGTAKWSLDH